MLDFHHFFKKLFKLFEFCEHFYMNGTNRPIFFHFADGDLGYYGNVLTAYMKQKHRMIWERRHGKIGSGRKDPEEAI